MSTSKKRTRDPSLQDEMLKYIADNPDATKQEVVDEFTVRYPSKAKNTLTQYYHNKRRDAGLKPNGKIGRHHSETKGIAKEVIRETLNHNPQADISDLKMAMASHPALEDLTIGTLQTYAYELRKLI